MTLEELENTLPNGLHDAEVQSLSVDYKQGRLTFDIRVWVGRMGESLEPREAYKNGRLEISGLLFLVMEPPDPKYPFTGPAVTIDGCEMRKNLSGELLKSLPHGSFFRSLWVNEWNAFIHIAAKKAAMVWADGRTTGQAKS